MKMLAVSFAIGPAIYGFLHLNTKSKFVIDNLLLLVSKSKSTTVQFSGISDHFMDLSIKQTTLFFNLRGSDHLSYVMNNWNVGTRFSADDL